MTKPALTRSGNFRFARELSQSEEAARIKEEQKRCFTMQLALAAERKLPVIIHSRDAAADTMAILKEYTDRAISDGSFRGGIIHCYAYSPEMAEEYVSMG